MLHLCDIGTSKSDAKRKCFVQFDLQMYLAPQRRAIFRHPRVKKWPEHLMFLRFWLDHVLRATAACNFFTSELPKMLRQWRFLAFRLENVLLATAACNFSFLLWTATSAPAALPSVLFDPADPQIIEKTQHFATSLTFRACWSSFYWLSRNLLLFSAFSSSDSATLLCFFNCPYCRKLDF